MTISENRTSLNDKVHSVKGVDYVLKSLEKILSTLWVGKFANLKVVVPVFLFSLVVHVILFPGILKNYQDFFTQVDTSDYDFLSRRSIDLREVYTDSNISTFSHHYKLKYRLTLPFLAKMVGQEYLPFKIFFVELLAGFLFIGLLFNFLKDNIQDKVTAFYLLCILSGTYVLSAMRMDFSAYGDSIAFLFLLLAVSRNNLIELFLYSQIAAWTDERAVVALITVVIFWWLIGKKLVTGKSGRHVGQLSVIVFSVVLYGIVRLWMEKYYYVFDNGTNLSGTLVSEFIMTITENVKNLGFSIWRGYKGLAFFVPLATLFLWINDNKVIATFFSIIFAACVGFSFIAFDLSRSLSYFYLLPVFAVFILNKYLTVKEIRTLLLLTFLTTFINPDLTFFRFTSGFSIY